MELCLRPISAFILFLYGLTWMRFDYDQVRKSVAYTPNSLSTEKLIIDYEGISDIFDDCEFEAVPLWTKQLEKMMNPMKDPMKSCNRSFLPWSTILPDGRVWLTDRWDEESDCRARSVLLRSEFKHYYGEWKEVREMHRFENEVIEVECTLNQTVVYNFLHTQIRNNSTKEAKRANQMNKTKQPSVYIIVVDSIGASHGRRAFSLTQSFLKENFDAVEMKNVNKVGDNSRPNGIAFLFGKMIMPLKRDMYGLPSVSEDWNRNEFCRSFLDEKGFILKEFEKVGYKSMMAEDWHQGVFNWPNCYGFNKQPTTHYMRPFQLRLNKDHPKVLRETMGRENCFEHHLFLNDYHEQFMRAYPDNPKISLTWASYLGHDSANNVFHADVHYRDFFERNKEELDDSFVFFMGDHGLRFGSYIRTPSGARDVNNPMVMMSLPRRYRDDETLMRNVKHNSEELLTLFDIHATFVDIAETFSSNETTNFSKTRKNSTLRGSSLLRPLPSGKRNCKTLPIPPQYCICKVKKTKVNITSEFTPLGIAIASNVNERLKEAGVDDICAELQLDQMTSLSRVADRRDLYDAAVKMKPGGGIFQTYVREEEGGKFSVVVPDVMRVNKYGRQADCTKNNEIRPLCYCKSNMAKRSAPLTRNETRTTHPFISSYQDEKILPAL